MIVKQTRVLAGAIFACLIVAAPFSASADEKNHKPDPQVNVGCQLLDCGISANRHSTGRNSTSTRQGTARKPSNGGQGGVENPYWDPPKAKAEFERKVAIFGRQNAAYEQCILSGGSTCQRPSPPDPLLRMWFIGIGGPPAIQISPGQAGAIAVARLKLPTVAPGIGPPPDLNRWKMAAVGYPLWLWADGPTHVGPVSDSVAGLSVSLEGNVTSLTFRMGDGSTVQCPGDGDKWTKAVEPGAKAPRCGHTYTRPSLPDSNYKVSAVTNWAVTWTANGQSGVIDVPAVQTTELPVGELQVLVR